jgi:uncharacterized ferredoxin-like protein
MKKGVEEQGLRTIAELMCVAARTAPKGRGYDNIEILLLEGEAKSKVSAKMREIGERTGAAFFLRDAGCRDQAPLAVVIGTRHQTYGIPACGTCGFGDCEGCEKAKGRCHFVMNDLGIALGSAASVAIRHHADNRIMFTVGKAALELGLFSESAVAAHGIPLSATGKNIFFDRK